MTFIISDLNEKKAIEVAKSFGAKVKTTSELAATCDVVIVSVPIGKSAETIWRAAERMKFGALLIDVCSVKSVLKNSFEFAKKLNIEILSIHPLFGPRIRKIKNRKIPFIRVKTGEASNKFLKILEDLGFNIFETTIEEHDIATATTQALPALFLLGLTEAADRRFSTTNFDKLLKISKKIRADRKLYSEIIQANPHSKSALQNLMGQISTKK